MYINGKQTAEYRTTEKSEVFVTHLDRPPLLIHISTLAISHARRIDTLSESRCIWRRGRRGGRGYYITRRRGRRGGGFCHSCGSDARRHCQGHQSEGNPDYESPLAFHLLSKIGVNVLSENLVICTKRNNNEKRFYSSIFSKLVVFWKKGLEKVVIVTNEKKYIDFSWNIHNQIHFPFSIILKTKFKMCI